MVRKQFRKARVAVKMDMYSEMGYGHRSDVPGYQSALYLHLSGKYDVLAARLGGFSTDARTRITLYPLASGWLSRAA